MAEGLNGARHRQELVNVIREVRKRWRMKLLLRGGIAVLGGGLLTLILASYGLQTTKFSPSSVTGFRVAVFGVLAALLALAFLHGRRRVTDMQVALYVEEHEPKLQAAILSAVEVSASGRMGDQDVPAVIVERMVDQAIEKCRTIDGGKAIGRQALQRYAVGLTTVAGVAMLLMIVGPEFLRQGASALLVLSKSAQAASPYAISVTPGDASVPKGSDQTITAKLAGFRSNDVALMVKTGGEGKFERMPLVATGDPTTFEGMLFDLKKPIEYYVESDGVRSPNYEMKVVALPAVAKLELEYIFPAYTGLPPQKVESGGDVAALRGTEVRVRIEPTMTSPAGRLQIDPQANGPVTAQLAVQSDGSLTGSFKIDQDGFYHVELDSTRGDHVTASPKYTIDAIDDQPPTVSFEKPKRDTSASPVDEVVLQARADDDFGVKQLDLIYSINGGEEKSVTLFGKGAKPLPNVSASHTIYMEELGVKPGDFVSYYAKALDTDTVKGPKATSSDIYFVKVRPFNQNFRQAQSQEGGGGGGGGGGGNNQVGALSEQERQIISATFNVERDKPKLAADKFKENTVFIGLSQSKLHDQVEELVGQLNQRLGGDETFKKIAEILPKAAAEMVTAQDLLKAAKTKDAMAPEQRALKYLQDAEQLYEIEIRQRQQGGGGGGGGGGQMAEDLADLFQLQLDRVANQYETQQRAQQQSAGQQIDQLAEKLKELARRQLAQADQQRRAAGRQQQAGGGTGASQRALADEMDQAARQLEQLRRDAERQGQQRQDLADAQRRLQEAADAARRAAANGTQDGGAQAQKALDALQQASDLLQNNSAARAGQDIKTALQQVDDLAKEQKDVASQVKTLDQAGAQKDAKTTELGDRKDQMRAKVGDLERQLGQLGSQALANNQRDAARKLQEAAGTIRDEQLQAKLAYSKEAMKGGSEYSGPIEKEIGSNIDTLRGKVAEAAGSMDKAQQGQAGSKALNQLGSSLNQMQTLDQNLRQAMGQGQQGQQGQGQQGQGQQGQQGQGQQGQQGQGQQGQQGQGQQGQQGQGQQGQQGQGQQGQQGQGQQGQGQGQQGQGQGQGRANNGQGQGQGAPGTQRLQQGDQQQSPAGMPNATAAGGDARPNGNMTGQDVRQFRNQANQIATDLQNVRRQLQGAGANAKDLQSIDEVVKGLKTLDNEKAYSDLRSLQTEAQALDTLKKVEYDMRKRMDTTNQQLFLSGSDEVPAQFKDLVQQYYRALSKKGGGGGGR